MTWLLLAKRFWPYLAVTAALLAVWAWHVGEIREARADERQKVTLAYQKALQDVITKREERLSEVSARYEKQIQSLGQSVAIELRGPPIRMCADPIRVSAPQDPGGVSAGPGGGPVASPPRDLRPEITAAGARCEKLRRQLIAIRELQGG